jgi:hypothetical protein
MSSSRLRKIALRWAPRLVSLAVQLGILCSMIPFAVGQQVAKDLSVPFPCQYRACGCRSAAQCWKRCCCFSNAQKLAWARANEVQPPEYVVVAAAKEIAPVKCESTGCCHQTSGGKKAATPPVTEPERQERTQYVIALLAQQCQGHHWYWNSLPWTILPLTEVVSHVPQRTSAKLELISEKLLVAERQPPVPPPR